MTRRAKLSVTLRRATPADSRFLWRLRNSADVRAVSGDAEKIPWRGHVLWYARIALMGIGRSDVRVILADGEPVGYVRAYWDTPRGGVDPGCWGGSIAITIRARGRGIGKAALRQFVRRHRPCRALVRADNEASLALFRSAGFCASMVELVYA